VVFAGVAARQHRPGIYIMQAERDAREAVVNRNSRRELSSRDSSQDRVEDKRIGGNAAYKLSPETTRAISEPDHPSPFPGV